MRITFVIPGAGGGGARVIVRYALGLDERGHDVRILHPVPRGGIRNRLRSMYLSARYHSRQDWFAGSAVKVEAFSELTAELVGRNDFVIGIGVDCVLAIAALPDWCGLKVHSSHGREPWHRDKMLRAWQIPMPRIAVSSHLIPEMRAVGVRDEIIVVHNGIDRTEYFPTVPDDRRNGVGTVYHGADVKDPELICAVFCELHHRRPALPLFAFGSFPRPSSLISAVQYTRLPRLPVARELYSRSQVWFCASRSEGFPGPVLEAMACGSAVVSTDCGGPADQIDDGKSGFIVPVGDADQMVERIVLLLDDTGLRRRFVNAAFARLELFQWPVAVAAFERALVTIQKECVCNPS
jgi:L-malate glycosyltransferase